MIAPLRVNRGNRVPAGEVGYDSAPDGQFLEHKRMKSLGFSHWPAFFTTEDTEKERRKPQHEGTKACSIARRRRASDKPDEKHGSRTRRKSSCLGWCDLRAFVVCLISVLPLCPPW